MRLTPFLAVGTLYFRKQIQIVKRSASPHLSLIFKSKHVANGQTADQLFQTQEATVELPGPVSKEIAPAEQGRRLCPEEVPCGVSCVESASPASHLVTSLISLCKSKVRRCSMGSGEENVQEAQPPVRPAPFSLSLPSPASQLEGQGVQRG